MARQARHYNSREALETRVDYVEGNLDKAITSFKEANARFESRLDETIKDFKEAIIKSENSLKEAIKDNKEALEKVVAKAESSRRWAIGTVISIAIAVIGSLVTFIVFLLNNVFQAPT